MPEEYVRPPVVLLALFAWLAATAWLRPLSLPDEGRYVGVAWEMLWSGNWLVPTLDTLPYFHKPPLFYWLSAAAMATFGVNEWAARLPSLLAATASAFALYLFIRRWLGESAARITLIVLATTPFFYGGAQFANLDMLVAGCISCTILFGAHAVLALDDARTRRRALAGAYLGAALGLLAKGLIGIVIPAAVIGLWVLAMGRPRALLRLIWLPGLALFAIVGLPWFAYMQARYPEFLNYFFLHHHFQRFAAQGFNNPQPFWFYLPVFALVTLPWSPLLAMLWRKNTAKPSLRYDVQSLMWIWLGTVLLFFSIPRSKLVGYVLPAVPPFAVLAAHAARGLLASAPAGRRRVAAIAAGAAALCVVAAVIARFHERETTGRLAAQVRAQVQPGDSIVALRGYPFSASYYLRLRRPILVIDDWDRPDILAKDNWQKELFEAAQFDPERGRALLIRLPALRSVLCSGRTVWVFAPAGIGALHPEMNSLAPVLRSAKDAVWRMQAPASVCAPAGGS